MPEQNAMESMHENSSSDAQGHKVLQFAVCPKPDDVPQRYFDEMMALVPKSAIFIESHIPEGETFKAWWRDFRFQLTEPLKDGRKQGDTITYSCPLLLK